VEEFRRRVLEVEYWAEKRPTQDLDLFSAKTSDLSLMAQTGAYVLATDGPPPHLFPYPLEASEVFYVGKTSSTVRRLLSHRKWAQAARAEFERWGEFRSRWYPRYSYAAAFGARVLWFSVKGKQTPSSLEATLIDRFFWTHGAIPVANGQWPVLQKISKTAA
jgi:hypothetical protein